MKRRIFSALLVLSMLLTMIPAVFAEPDGAIVPSTIPATGNDPLEDEIPGIPAGDHTSAPAGLLTHEETEPDGAARAAAKAEAREAARREEERTLAEETRKKNEAYERELLEKLARHHAQTSNMPKHEADTKIWVSADESHVYVDLNETATLQVTRYRDDSGEDLSSDDLTYQWYDGETGKTVNSQTDTYTTAKITRNRTYFCRVTDADGDMGDCWFYVYVNNELSVQPADGEHYVRAPYGKSASLKVEATARDPEGITYQWYSYNSSWDEMAISGATTNGYTTPAIKKQEYYYCVATDKYGNIASCSFTVNVDNQLQAVSVESGDWWENRLVPAGEKTTLKLKVTALDTSKLTYKWFRVNENGYWNPLSTTATTSLTTGVIKEHREYVCEVSDQYENYANVYFDIYVDNNLTVVSAASGSQYDERYVSPGSKETLKVKVTATETDGITYEWWHYYYDDNGEYITEKMTKVTGNSLTTVTINQYHGYNCKVTDKYGNTDYVDFNLWVENNLNAVSTRTGESWDERLMTAGETALLKVKATADDTTGLTYEWWREYTKDTGEFVSKQVTGETGPSLTTAAIVKYNHYYCIVRDQYDGTVAVRFDLHVENHLTAVSANTETEYDARRVTPGKTAALKVIATADNTTGLKYDWYRGYTNNNGNYVENRVADATGPSLTTVAIKKYNYYYCIITDRYGNTCQVEFPIYPENHLTAVSAKNNNYHEARGVTPGKTTTMTVKVTADDTTGLTYQWYREYIKDNGDYVNQTVANASEASLKSAVIKKQNEYRCVVTDRYGNRTEVYFDLYAENHLEVTPVGNTGKYVAYGKTADLKVKVNADDKTGIKYTWIRDDDEDGWTELPGVTGTSYTTPEIKKPQRYLFQVIDRYGNSDSCWFFAGVGNNFQAEPKDGENYVEVAYGKTATLTVKAGANNPAGITYQWCDDTGPIKGATKASYTTPAIKSTKDIYCLVADRYQNMESVYFSLHVKNDLQVKTTTAASGVLFVNKGDTKTLKVSATAANTTGLTYQWYYVESNGIDSKVAGAKASITTSEIQKDCIYYCYVTDKYNNTVSACYRIYVGTIADQKPDYIYVERTAGGMDIEWSRVPGATKYQIQRKAGSATSWTTIATVTDDESWDYFYLDKTVKTGTQYKYAVRAVRGTTYSKRAISDQLTCKKIVEGIKITRQNTQIKVTWNALSGAATYNVMRIGYNRTTHEATGWTTVKTGLKGTSFTDTTVVSGCNYVYSIQGVTSSGTKYTYDKLVPSVYFVTAPKLATATATTSGVKLTWKAKNGTGRYAILRKASGETTWTRVGITNQLSYTDTTAKAGKKYTYTIRSMDVQGKTYVSMHNTSGLTVTAK